jgi:uroporphyrin-III C-methyltransferase
MIEKINHISIKQIALVGAGPGGVEYLTLKALKAISQADVVLFDELIKDCFHDIVLPNAELINVGKRCSDGVDQNERQNMINRLILENYQAGKRVVRLKGGDPMLYGKITEEIQFLNSQHIDFEIIPGISAGQAGAAIFKIPLTVRGLATEVLLSTAQKINNELTGYSKMTATINEGTPIIIYMGGTKIESIAKAFIEKGVEHPVYLNVLSNVGTAEQTLISTTLLDALHNPPTDIKLPALLIIGKHAIPS